tara:strand:+ start:491 stop:778 length:288 start_codon:yes stop_codon:yes gene_type:complete
MNERIPRREAPDFRDSEDGLISSIVEDGFLNVALDDANQYGPHAMIIFLGLASVLTGSVLGLAMIDPILSAGTVILVVGSILINYLIAKFNHPAE